MKVLHFIMAVYVLTLTFYPCSDSSTCADEVRNGIALTSNQSHNHSGSELDICTPFCVCACCAAHIRIAVSNGFESKQYPHNSVFISAYIERPVLNGTATIWQPPRA